MAEEKAEAERLEAERLAEEKAEAERLEAERLVEEELARLEAERLAAETRERELQEELERQKQIEADIEAVRLEEEQNERELQERARVAREEQQRAALEEEQLAAAREEQRRAEEAEDERIQEEERLMRETLEAQRLEAEQQEEELERAREDELERQRLELLAMEEAEEKAREMQSQIMDDAIVLDDVDDKEDTLPSPRPSGLDDVKSQLDQLMIDEQELRNAIVMERESKIALRQGRVNSRLEHLTGLRDLVPASFEAVCTMSEAMLVELDPGVLEGLSIQVEELYSSLNQVLERCCDHADLVKGIVHGIRNMRAAYQLFLGQIADAFDGEAALEEENVEDFCNICPSLLHCVAEALDLEIVAQQRALAEITESEIAVDSELVEAHCSVEQQIGELRTQLARVMPAKPKKRIKSTAPRKALPTF